MFAGFPVGLACRFLVPALVIARHSRSPAAYQALGICVIVDLGSWVVADKREGFWHDIVC